ncbi:MAG TPA: MFS transporter [Candidatus Dormibacteraeota bacterium]|nr:MFS transporter [Candidatus Dormibacteraeota bacterium]
MMAERGRFRALAPLRVRDFAFFWSGRSASSAGDGIFTVALALLALQLDPNPVGLAYVLAARLVPSALLALVGGAVVDRVSRRSALLAADIVLGVVVAAVAILLATRTLGFSELLVMAAVFGAADAFSGPAGSAYLPELLPSPLLVAGNALNSTSDQLAQGFLGPAVGGAAVAAIGLAWAFGLDAASFAISAGCLFAMHARSRPPPSNRSFLSDVRQGVDYIRSRRWLWLLLVAAGVANFAGLAPLGVLIPLLVRQVLHGSPVGLGLVFAAGGVAGVVASLLAGHLGPPRRLMLTMWSAYGAAAIAVAAMAFSPDLVTVAVLEALSVGLIVYADVLYFSMMQQMVQVDLLGRVSSVASLMVTVGMPAGLLVAGVGASIWGTRIALLLSGLMSAVCALVVLVPGARPGEAR